MSLLTDDEKSLLVLEHLGPKALVHDTMSLLEAFELGLKVAETEVIKKLAAGVDVEPDGTVEVVSDTFMFRPGDTVTHEPAYSLDQLQTAIAAARVKVLNEAAKAIHNLPSNSERCADLQLPLQAWDEALEDAERAVRALIGANK